MKHVLSVLMFVGLSCGRLVASRDGGAPLVETPSDGGGPSWTQAECIAVMDKLALGGCTDQNAWVQAKASMCSKVGTSKSITCERQFKLAEHCQKLFIDYAYVGCRPTGDTDVDDAWVMELLKAANCAMSTNDTQCAGASCTSATACAANSSCNPVTGKCVDLAAECIALPCAADSDCPSSETCVSGLCALR